MSQSLASLQPPPGAPATAWAARISACWQASVKAILEVGRLLKAAKDALPHGEFGAMCDTDLPFGTRTAEMLMAIAADPRLTNPKHVSLLPSHWGTLYELTKLTDEQFEKGIETGTITPELERKRVIDAARAIAPGRSEPSDSLDYFPTPPWATRALIERVLPKLGVNDIGRVWEPACGEGHISGVLQEYTDWLAATDVFDYSQDGRSPPGWWRVQDFLREVPDDQKPDHPVIDWIITNPPFDKKALQFARRALDIAMQGVALFVRWQWIETIGRYEELFQPFPPTLVCPFVERVNLCKGRWEPDGGTATAYCWIVWLQPLSTAALSTRMFWIPPGCQTSLTRPDDVERFTAHPVIKKSEPEAQRDDTALTAAPASMDDDRLLDLPSFLKRKDDNLLPVERLR